MFGFTTPAAVFSHIATPDAPLIIDVCNDADFAADPRLIPTAHKMGHRDVSRAALPLGWGDKDIVVTCQKGLKLSQGSAARLWAEGCRVQVLQGGVQAWHAAGLPSVHQSRLPASNLWVTCPGPQAALAQWLLARWAPGGQTLMIVAAETITAVAQMFDAKMVSSAAEVHGDLALSEPKRSFLAAATPTLTDAARHPLAGTPLAPALTILDTAYHGFLAEGADI